MTPLILAIFLLILALLPCAMAAANLKLFQPATNSPEYLQSARSIPVSVLIPARNEENSIQAALEALAKSSHPTFEVLVLDDASHHQNKYRLLEPR